MSKSLWSLVVNESTQHAGEAEETSRVMTFINHFTCEQAAFQFNFTCDPVVFVYISKINVPPTF